MNAPKPRYCVRCGKPGTLRRPLSTRGLCPPCARKGRLSYVRARSDRTSPEYAAWKAACDAARAQRQLKRSCKGAA